MKARCILLTPLGFLLYLSHNMVSWNQCLVVVYYQFHYMHTYAMPLLKYNFMGKHILVTMKIFSGCKLQYDINAQHIPTIVKVKMNVTMLYLCHWVWASISFEINKWVNRFYPPFFIINFLFNDHITY